MFAPVPTSPIRSATARRSSPEGYDLFRAQFDLSTWPQVYTPADDIGRLVPLGTRRLSSPTTFALTDRNGIRRYCIAEAIKTTWHVMVLILVKAPLTPRHIIFPAGFADTA
jgi:hypothetical protein